jgi:hypothetical protein
MAAPDFQLDRVNRKFDSKGLVRPKSCCSFIFLFSASQNRPDARIISFSTCGRTQFDPGVLNDPGIQSPVTFGMLLILQYSTIVSAELNNWIRIWYSCVSSKAPLHSPGSAR